MFDQSNMSVFDLSNTPIGPGQATLSPARVERAQRPVAHRPLGCHQPVDFLALYELRSKNLVVWSRADWPSGSRAQHELAW